MSRKKGDHGEGKKKCCNMWLCHSEEGASHMCRETRQRGYKGNMLKDTCFLEGAVCEQHLVCATLQQPCANGKRKGTKIQLPRPKLHTEPQCAPECDDMLKI